MLQRRSFGKIARKVELLQVGQVADFETLSSKNLQRRSSTEMAVDLWPCMVDLFLNSRSLLSVERVNVLHARPTIVRTSAPVPQFPSPRRLHGRLAPPHVYIASPTPSNGETRRFRPCFRNTYRRRHPPGIRTASRARASRPSPTTSRCSCARTMCGRASSPPSTTKYTKKWSTRHWCSDWFRSTFRAK